MKLSETILEPVFVENVRDFPYDEQIPEGCTEVDAGFQDDFGYHVYFFERVYASRDGMDLHLHVYQPQLQRGEHTDEENQNMRWPVIIYVQGSAFHKQFMFEHANMLMRLAGHGFLVCSAEYRPSDVAPFPAQEQDCKTAIRYVKKYADEFRADADRIAIWGDSSGGHTVLMAGFTGDGILDTDLYQEYSSEVSCMIDWYGPVDFAKMNFAPTAMDHRSKDSPEWLELGGKDALESPDANAAASPVTYLSADRKTPPLMIVHGGRDMLVPFSQSVLLYEKMKELNKDVSFIKIKNGNHGFNGFGSEKLLELMEKFLRKYI